MKEREKRKIISYFHGSVAASVVFFVFALVFLQIGIYSMVNYGSGKIGGMITFVGVLLAGLGFLMLFLFKRRKISGEQMDRWMDEDLAGVTRKGLAELGLDSAALVEEPIVVFGPKLSLAKSIGMFIKKGGDGIIRYTPIAVRVFAFTVDHLHTYSCLFNSLTGKTLQEGSEKVAYGDIQFVGTRTSHCSTWGVHGLGLSSLSAASLFQISTPAGQSQVLIVGSREVEAKLDGKLAKVNVVADAIERLRAAIDARK